MVSTAQDLKNAGISVPIMVGGAALTRKFTKTRIRPEYDGMVLYAKDAMDGLALANQLSDPVQRTRIAEEIKAEQEADAAAPQVVKVMPKLSEGLRSKISTDAPVYLPPDMERHVPEIIRFRIFCHISTCRCC